jgi:hypothetical protein
MKNLTFVSLLAVTSVAFAQPQPQQPPRSPKAAAQADLGAANSDRPWAKGVSPAEQKIAIDMFREGNTLLKESLFVQAAAKYREALTHWNHPGVHYNLALALLNLDQPVEVFQQLQEAMKYGAAPLDADKFEHAGRYKALIEKQLARVEIVCNTRGAVVTLDGQQIFVAPGQYEGLVRVGQHTLVAQKTGFVTTQKTPSLPAGQKTTIDMMMYTADELTAYKRRWHVAMPWAVLAGGVVLAGVGGILHWQASESYKSYDAGINMCAMGSASGGCMPNSGLAGKKTTGDGLQAGAFAMYAVGGAVVITGGVLAYLNRARPVRLNPGETDHKLTVIPVVGPGVGGGMVSLNF